MKKLLLLSTVLLLSACETTPYKSAEKEVVPIANYTCWDGSVASRASQCPAQSYTCWDGSIGTNGCPPAPMAAKIAAEPSVEDFAEYESSGFRSVLAEPVSTFSADVDTASYAYVRGWVERGELPPADSVRVEEMINYFDYDYLLPESKEEPFRPTVAVMPTPWSKNTQLLHIGIKGYNEISAERPPLNLVFLVDVSGSMNSENKLPLVKKSLALLVDQMRPNDRISLVTYASGEKVVLKAARASDKDKILAEIDALKAEGSTAGEAGMQKAYELAERYYKRGGVNRVIMATDGDFNVGISDPEELKTFVSEKRESGIYLSIFGYGVGNLKDDRIQALAQNGNGTAGYIDSIREARKVFDDDFSGNLFPIADDVKLQVEFNPARVGSYRLIGYETRALNREDFNDDTVDAGDIGAGHTVTAIYEITPQGVDSGDVDPLRYAEGQGENPDFAGEYAFVKIRYKLPKAEASKLITQAVTDRHAFASIDRVPASSRWASAVAAYGLKLRGDEQLAGYSWDEVTGLARGALDRDPYGYKAEFVQLTRDAASIRDEG